MSQGCCKTWPWWVIVPTDYAWRPEAAWTEDTGLPLALLKVHLMKSLFTGSAAQDFLQETSRLTQIDKNPISFHST